MIPLGSGVQIVADIPPKTGAVIDIGSRVQAEKPLDEAIDILTKRTEEILELMNKMKIEFSSIEETTISLANVFNEQIASLQAEQPEEIPEKKSELQAITPKKQGKKRKRGTELTLDD
jgi:prefoldin subunit 5